MNRTRPTRAPRTPWAAAITSSAAEAISSGPTSTRDGEAT